MPCSMHIEMTALSEHINEHLKIHMNVCCMGACGHLPDNARIIPCIIVAIYSFICTEIFALQYLLQYTYYSHICGRHG